MIESELTGFLSLEALLVPIVVTVLMLALYGGWRWLYPLLSGSTEAIAEIQRLSPRYGRTRPRKTLWVDCSYQFEARGRTYEGECVLPLRYFFGKGLPLQPILDDDQVGLSVLAVKSSTYVGGEQIEHVLLGMRSSLPVRYRNRNPAHHTPMPDRERVSTQIKHRTA
ncbi:MAG: hypothetical protein H7A21_19665 [Spirochaetales bacterium]|nr:hypothetical protein [Leptospiraceae bacterium]MCP5483665.1 hypothetical protein [Spirochaetales bacterium]